MLFWAEIGKNKINKKNEVGFGIVKHFRCTKFSLVSDITASFLPHRKTNIKKRLKELKLKLAKSLRKG